DHGRGPRPESRSENLSNCQHLAPRSGYTPRRELTLPPAHPMHETEPDLRENLRILRARKWEVLGVLLIVVASALALAARQTPVYQGTAEVIVEQIQNPLNPYAAPQAPNLDTERQLIESQVIAELLKKNTKTPLSTEALLKHLQVSVIGDTDALSIMYNDS